MDAGKHGMTGYRPSLTDEVQRGNEWHFLTWIFLYSHTTPKPTRRESTGQHVPEALPQAGCQPTCIYLGLTSIDVSLDEA
jgi:hypothetical protein